MSVIKTENICKNFGSLQVLKNVSLTVEQGEVVVIIGPSGAGKSTYLRSLNRLEKLQKTTGLDIRNFDDALTFRIALMITSYLNYIKSGKTV